MKKSTTSLSPFIMLLVPALLAILLSATNSNKKVAAEKQPITNCFSVPALKGVIQALY